MVLNPTRSPDEVVLDASRLTVIDVSVQLPEDHQIHPSTNLGFQCRGARAIRETMNAGRKLAKSPSDFLSKRSPVLLRNSAGSAS